MICSWTRIENLVVPPVVEEGEDQVVLDCPFTFTQQEEEGSLLDRKDQTDYLFAHTKVYVG